MCIKNNQTQVDSKNSYGESIVDNILNQAYSIELIRILAEKLYVKDNVDHSVCPTEKHYKKCIERTKDVCVACYIKWAEAEAERDVIK